MKSTSTHQHSSRSETESDDERYAKPPQLIVLDNYFVSLFNLLGYKHVPPCFDFHAKLTFLSHHHHPITCSATAGSAATTAQSQ